MGSGDGGGTQVAARARFCGDIGMGMREGGAPKLISGCGRSPKGLRFELEIKSKFN
jgi:hypothetical protein